MKNNKFTVVHTLKKVLMVTILLVSMSSTMVGCGIQEHNEYVEAIDALGEAIISKETEGVALLEDVVEEPGDMEALKSCVVVMEELADLYGRYDDIVPIKLVVTEHEELVEATYGVIDLYTKLANLMADEEFDLTNIEVIFEFLEVTLELDESSDVFIEKMDQLIEAVNN